jgi:hypothetical protein
VGLKQLAQRESKPRASIHAVSCKPRGAAGSLAVALEGKSETSGSRAFIPLISRRDQSSRTCLLRSSIEDIMEFP